MKTHPIRAPLAFILTGAAFLFGAPLAQAQQVNWSVTVGTPNVQPVYAPAPVYVQPQRVYVAPAPVYVQPQRVYVPPPVYVQPYSPPVAVVQYRESYPAVYYGDNGRHHGHGGKHHGWHHGHGD